MFPVKMVMSYQKSPCHDLSIAARVRHGRDFLRSQRHWNQRRRADETGPESRVEKGDSWQLIYLLGMVIVHSFYEFYVSLPEVFLVIFNFTSETDDSSVDLGWFRTQVLGHGLFGRLKDGSCGRMYAKIAWPWMTSWGVLETIWGCPHPLVI